VNPLEQNPRARRIAYQVFWVVSLVVGCTQIGFAAADADQPTAVTVALAILPFVSAAIGYTAQANVSAAPIQAQPDQVILVEDGSDLSGLDKLDGLGTKKDETGAWDTGNLLFALACIVVILVGVVWLIHAL
jgi:hypothetical protein